MQEINLKSIDHNVSIREGFFEDLNIDEPAHCVLIATKPDIIKQAPLILEMRKRGVPHFVCHTGQHYDWNLSGGLEQEFDIKPDINLNIDGPMYEKHSQLIYRFGEVLSRIKKKGGEVIPYPHGDTLTAVAGGIGSYMNEYAVAHIEAGLRTLTPPLDTLNSLLKIDLHKSDFDIMDYYNKLQTEQFEYGSNEPYPEQFDTRCAAATAGLHFAPTELNRTNLLNEGYPEDRIHIVGNTVVDALRFAEDRVNKSKIFEKYPALEDGEFVRFCIHRRENVSNEQRFKSIYSAMKQRITAGKNTLLISLGATEMAFRSFGLKEEIQKLDEQFENFIYSPVWPFYTDVIAATKKCRLVATDSGSMQEECNMLGVPCATLRFNSDRPESIMAGSNILAPPINGEIVNHIISQAEDNDDLNRELSSKKNLYGENVSSKVLDIVTGLKEPLFRFDHTRLKFDQNNFWKEKRANW